MKTCTKCKIEKTNDNFYFSGITKDNLSYSCKSCGKIKRDNYKHREREVKRQYQAFLRKEKFEYIIFHSAKSRSKINNINFNLNIDDIIIPEKCPVLDILLSKNNGKDFVPSIDRINPKLGYVKENILIVSWEANKIKNNATIEELQLVFNNWFNIYKGIENTNNINYDCKIKLIESPHKTFCDNSPSLDRIDNEKGYTNDNIRIISWKANRLKGTAIYTEYKQLYEFYKAFQ